MNTTAGYPAGAAGDPSAPWKQGYTTIEEREITRRAEELAIECWDDAGKEYDEWIADQCPPDVVSVINTAWQARGSDYVLGRHLERLRERFIEETRDLFRRQSEDELRERQECRFEE